MRQLSVGATQEAGDVRRWRLGFEFRTAHEDDRGKRETRDSRENRRDESADHESPLRLAAGDAHHAKVTPCLLRMLTPMP